MNRQPERRLHMGCGESLCGRLPLRPVPHVPGVKTVAGALKPAFRRSGRGKDVDDGHE